MATTLPSSIPSRHAKLLGHSLFMVRLYRDGKLADYLDEKKAGKPAPGLVAGVSGAGSGRGRIRLSTLRKKYGYVGYLDELRRYETFQHTPIYNRRKELQAEAMKSRGRAAIGKALAELPPVAPVEQEMAWVRSHPKMTDALTRKLTQKADEEYKPPRLGIADLSDITPACPSRGAWNTLLAALSDPKKFNDVLLTKQKDGAVKPAEATADTEDLVTDDLEEAKRLLAHALST